MSETYPLGEIGDMWALMGKVLDRLDALEVRQNEDNDADGEARCGIRTRLEALEATTPVTPGGYARVCARMGRLEAWKSGDIYVREMERKEWKARLSALEGVAGETNQD